MYGKNVIFTRNIITKNGEKCFSINGIKIQNLASCRLGIANKMPVMKLMTNTKIIRKL